MDDILAPIQDAFEGQVDFHGQRITEALSTTLLIISGVVASVAGYIFQDIYLTLWSGLVGTLITAIIVIPPWPWYNQHPQKWLVPLSGGASGARLVVDGLKVA